MKDIDRRSILRNLADEQYEDILRVCKSYPYIEMKTKVNGNYNKKKEKKPNAYIKFTILIFFHLCLVIDDEDDRVISVNALVTVIVNLERHSLEKLFDNEEKELPNDTSNAAEEETEEKEKHATIAAIAAASPNKNGKKETKNSTKEVVLFLFSILFWSN